MTLKVDLREVEMFAVQCDLAAKEVLPEAVKVVAKGSLNVKTDGRARAPKGPHTPHYQRSITYDTRVAKTMAVGEIGPDLEKNQGPLGGLFELGTPTSPPQPHMAPAGDAEEPRFYKAMEDLAARLIQERKT